jgi:hypothetical protein
MGIWLTLYPLYGSFIESDSFGCLNGWHDGE